MLFEEGWVPAVDPQALPDAVTEDEARVEHGHHSLVARLQLTVDIDEHASVAFVLDVLMRTVHGRRSVVCGRHGEFGIKTLVVIVVSHCFSSSASADMGTPPGDAPLYDGSESRRGHVDYSVARAIKRSGQGRR